MSINRYELIKRHNPVLRDFSSFSPLTVGNGEIAFSADITGFQTFPQIYENHTPLCTQSQWGWHTTPPAPGEENFSYGNLELGQYEVNGRKVGYVTKSEGQEGLFTWLRENPHRLHLGQIGLGLTLSGGKKAEPSDLKEAVQTLDLWRGNLLSRFKVEGKEVAVQTLCHPQSDMLAFHVKSPLITTEQLEITFAFPYASHKKTAAYWSKEDRHTTEIVGYSENTTDLLRVLDGDRYFVRLTHSPGCRFIKTGRNRFSLKGREGSGILWFSVSFSPVPHRQPLPSFHDTQAACETHWEDYWSRGGAIDFTGSTDKRAGELERRIVLSRYLLAIQCAGTLPPQETGLTYNSWYGKFHLEMHWWHGVHFPLWGRPDLLEKSLWWYISLLPKAQALARSQGYKGARWPKMVSPEGMDSPSVIGPLLIWQQPHPIYYAELCYRARPTPETLALYRDLVLETAAFLASYAHHDPSKDRYVLGPGLIPAQENHAPEITLNPTFELEYWAFGLKTANLWRRRLSLEPDKNWEAIASGLAPLPVGDGVYLAHENCPDTFKSFNHDHPSMLGALGVLPGTKAEPAIMEQTLRKVLNCWHMDSMWGWDYPMMAMTAARLGLKDLAVDLLLLDTGKNTYSESGHNRQADDLRLTLYLPGNGGLLTAVAMMAAGWDGKTGGGNTAAFPDDGSWQVAWEGLAPMP